MKAISADITSIILSHLQSGHSHRQIAKTCGVSTATVSRLSREHLPSLPKPSGGRPSKLSSHDLCHTIRLITSGKAENAVQVAKTLQDIKNTSISPQTIRRHLKELGLKAVVKKKRPRLTKRHRKDRLDWAIEHKNWTLEDWKRVVWSDETKINRLGSDGRKWVWKKENEGLNDRLVEGTLKFGGGSIMIWGCMFWEGPGYATHIQGKMDADLYVSILDDELQQSLQYYHKNPQDVLFQQDNDPKHTSRKAKDWFSTHDIPLMWWPAQSPDLNPIEHLWNHLKRKLAEYEEPPKGIHELWERVQVEWDQIGAGVCQNLIESMPRRVEEVIKAKGGYTKY